MKAVNSVLAPWDAYIASAGLSFAVRKICPPPLPPAGLTLEELVVSLIQRAHHHLELAGSVEAMQAHAPRGMKTKVLVLLEADVQALVCVA